MPAHRRGEKLSAITFVLDYWQLQFGEPSINALTRLAAITDDVAAAGEYRVFPRLDAPATAERILMAVAQVRQKRAKLVKTKVRG
jgi:hypothetical protein